MRAEVLVLRLHERCERGHYWFEGCVLGYFLLLYPAVTEKARSFTPGHLGVDNGGCMRNTTSFSFQLRAASGLIFFDPISVVL